MIEIRKARAGAQYYSSPLNFSYDPEREQKVQSRTSLVSVPAERPKDKTMVDIPANLPRKQVSFSKPTPSSGAQHKRFTPAATVSKHFPVVKSALKPASVKPAYTKPASAAATAAPVSPRVSRIPTPVTNTARTNVCFACGKSGHFLRDCPSKDKRQQAVKQVLLLAYGDVDEPEQVEDPVDPDFDPESIAEVYYAEDEGLEPYEYSAENDEELLVGSDTYSENY